MEELTRRDVLRGAGVLAGATALTSGATAAAVTAEGTVAISEGTNISAHVSPDGRQVAFDLVTAIWTVPITGGPARRLTSDDTDATQPSWSPDGRTLVFQAYRDGNYHLYTIRADGDGPRQLTTGPFDHREPRFSPDGRSIAFSSDRGGSYGVHTLEVATGTITARTDTAAEEAMPTWSRDGRRLAYTVDGTAIDVLDLASGAVTRAVTDSLSWQGKDRLLYLHNGTLRSVSVGGGASREVPLSLRWHPARVRQHDVIRAGAVWDGQATRLRERVDIVVDRGKIVDVLPRGARSYTVDARTLTVMPGLIDAHVHWHLRGRQWGDRQGRVWLAYGITTTRSPGDPAYQYVETRESLDSGDRVGPRYFGTGEAVDGSRVYYNFMRPTRSVAQLALELERAKALGYEMVKTYVRLPVAYQRRVVAAAHRAGIPLSSHYLYPAERIGMDGMEHTGATNRLGYSHTVSRLGRAYADAVTLFAESGMSITPTLFNSAAMYAFDRSLVEDERTRTLFPTWEYAAYVAKADAARTPANAPVLALLAANVNMVLRIHRAGGFVISGTDAPLDNPAVSLHTNLRAKVHFGFTPYEALTTATINPARWLNLKGELGEIRKGAQADLSFVQGNPLTDINAAAAVQMVMKAGRLHTIEDLLAPFTTPAARTVPALATQAAAADHTSEFWWHEPERMRHYCC